MNESGNGQSRRDGEKPQGIEGVRVGPARSNEGDTAIRVELMFEDGEIAGGWIGLAAAENLITMLRGSLDAIERGEG